MQQDRAIMGIERILEFLNGSAIGLFGAGHLGRTIAVALLDAGLPRQQLLLCHGQSHTTAEHLVALGIADRTETPQRILDGSKMVFYLVRPQSVDAIGGWKLRPDCLFVSFLAGVNLSRIPVDVPEDQRMRVMTSAPDTLANRNGIAAIYPAARSVVDVVLELLGCRVQFLPSEDRIHAFTALGPCLPLVAAYWMKNHNAIDRSDLLDLASRYGFSDYQDILDWALQVCPARLEQDAWTAYLSHAATPGGVTDAIIKGLHDGMDLTAALEQGIFRSRQLAEI